MKQGSACTLRPEILQKLADKLPAIVAEALDTPGNINARLGPRDIEIWHSLPGLLDRNTKPLTLLIIAHGYDERVTNLEERKYMIVRGVRRIIGPHPPLVGWAWVFTGKTAFGAI
jgi:hypothetical protein